MAEGATVYASDVDRAKLDGLARAKKAKLNVLSTKAVESYAAEGRASGHSVAPSSWFVDIMARCSTTSEKDWNFPFDLNVKSMHRTIRAFLPGMLERAKETGKTSSIVNIASGASSIRGIPKFYALRHLEGSGPTAPRNRLRPTSSARAYVATRWRPAPSGSPSWAHPRRDARQGMGGSKEKALDMFVQRQPMGRVAEFTEIAPIVVYLASDEAAFTTGAVMLVDGRFRLADGQEPRNSAIAAAVILVGFGLFAFFMPNHACGRRRFADRGGRYRAFYSSRRFSSCSG